MMINKSGLIHNFIKGMLWIVLLYAGYFCMTSSLIEPDLRADMYAMYVVPIKNHPFLSILYVLMTAFFVYINVKKKQDKKSCVIGGMSIFWLLFGLYCIREVTFLNENIRVSFVFLLISLMALMTLSVFITYIHKFSVYTFYFLVLISLGTIYYLAILPWSAPDAWRHMAATYRFSNIVLQENEWSGRKIDSDFFENVWMKYLSPNRSGYKAAVSNINQKVNTEKTEELSITDEAMECYSFVSYIPLITGVVLGRVLRFNTIWLAYLAKLFMFLFYTVGVYVAIRTIPKLKYVMAMIAVLPISLMYSSGFSYDGMVIITTFNFIACVLSLNEEYSQRKMIMLLMWTFLMTATKGGGYIILLTLIFVLKNQRFHIMMILATALLSLFLFNDFLYTDKPMFQMNYLKEGYLSTSFAFEHPFLYVKMVFYMYVNRFSYILYTMLGARLGWPILTGVFPTIPPMVILLLFILLLIVCFREGLEIREGMKYNFILFLTLLIASVTVPALLLRETKIGAQAVFGIQGRYYLPFLPVFMFFIAGFVRRLPCQFQKIIEKIDINAVLCLYITILYVSAGCMMITFLRAA